MDPVTAQLQQSFQEFGRVSREAAERFQANTEQALAIGQDFVNGYTRAAMAFWRRASAWDFGTSAPPA